MYTFLGRMACFVAAVVLCSAAANATITFTHQYNLGENDPGATIGNPGNSTTIDHVGSLNLDVTGTPTYVAGSGQLGSTIGMNLVTNPRPTPEGQNPAAQYYNGVGTGVTTGYNWGFDFWLKVNSFPTITGGGGGIDPGGGTVGDGKGDGGGGGDPDKDQWFVHVGGGGGAYTGTSNWGVAIGTYSDGVHNYLNVTDWSGMGARINHEVPLGTWTHVVYVDKTPLGPGQADGNAHVYIDDVEYPNGEHWWGVPFMWQNPAGPPTTMPERVMVGAMHFYGYNNDIGGYRGGDGVVDSLRLFTFAEGQFNIEDTTTGGTTPFPGDANGDGTVDGADLNIVLSNYNLGGMNWAQGDFDGNGTVDGADLNVVLSNYNQHASASSAPGAPEPSTLLLAATGLLGLLAYARRKRK
jgi:hypothetical protein